MDVIALSTMLLSSVFSIVSAKIMPFIFFLFLIFFLSFPLGTKILLQTKFLEENKVSKGELVLLALPVGFCTTALFLYFGTLLSINSILLFAVLFILNILITMWLIKAKNGQKIVDSSHGSKVQGVISFLLAFLFLYYAINPLALEYGFARDYDVAALGIKESSTFVLGYTSIQTYYPPLVATLGAHFSTILESLVVVNTNNTLLFISSIVLFFIVTLAYSLGFFIFRSRKAGLCFLLVAVIMPVTRNAVIGGSTYPAQLANVYLLLFLLFTQDFFICKNKKAACFAGITLAGIFLSHLDIFFILLWVGVALLLSALLFMQEKKQILHFILLCLLFGAMVSSPYFIYGWTNKDAFDAMWTEEKWLEKAKGESHPKNMGEMQLFVGKTSIVIIALSLLISLYILLKSQTVGSALEKAYSFFCVMLVVLLVAQNSWWMLVLSKKIIHIYPLNIIMWMGVVVPIIVIGGFGMWKICSFLETINKKGGNLFLALLFFLAFASVIDYETINVQETYRPGAGFLWSALSEKNVVVTSADATVLRELRNSNITGTVLVPDTYAGYYFVVATEKNATLFFYEAESYHDPTYEGEINARIEETENFFVNKDTERAKKFIEQYNISYIYLPSSQGEGKGGEQEENGGKAKQMYDAALFEMYPLVMRNGGAKILAVHMPVQEDNASWVMVHQEAEQYSSKERTKEYYYAKSIWRKTVLLDETETVMIPFSRQCFTNATVYVHRLTYPIPVQMEIIIGNQTFKSTDTSEKIRFSESAFLLVGSVCADTVQITRSKTDDWLLKKLPLEIDWIEIGQEQ